MKIFQRGASYPILDSNMHPSNALLMKLSRLSYCTDLGAPVAQSVERWTCDWKVAGSNPGLEGPCETISIFSAPCANSVFRVRHKTEASSQLPNGAGLLN